MPRRVCDRVHGEVYMQPFVAALAETRVFCRLDRVRQLGGCASIYPSATHTRREHSIGVSYLAGELGRHLRRLYPNLVDDDDILCLEVAGLVHDLGHGPFSHTFEDYMTSMGHSNWSHEDMGCDMLRDIFFDLVDQIMPFSSGTADQHFRFVCLLVCGMDASSEWPPLDVTNRGVSKRFMLDVVHNRLSGIDVDKLDYLVRDSLAALGANRPLNLSRLIHSVRVSNHNGLFQLAFDENVAFEVAEVYALRARLHRQVYQHHAVILVESLVIDLMRAIDSVVPETERFYNKALAATSFGSITDASILSHPMVDHEYVRPFFNALFAWPTLIHTRSTVVLRTLPTCVNCGGETEFNARFCTHCGTSTANRVGVLDGGLLVTPECLIDSRDATEQMKLRLIEHLAAKVRVHILDVQCGKGVSVVDPHGFAWRQYDPLERILFVDKAGCSTRISSAYQHVPRVRHVRSARCYLMDTNVSEEDRRHVDNVFVAWGREVGTVVEEFE